MIEDRIKILLPASLDSERGLLCSFCLSPQTVGAMFAERKIAPEHFTNPIHAKMCEKMGARWTEGRAINMRLVMKDMEDGKDGEIYASEILSHVPTALYAEEFADAVIEKHTLREIINRTRELNASAWADDAQSGPILEALATLSALAAPKTGEVSFKTLLLDKMRRMEDGEPNEDLISTGIAMLDRDSPLRIGDMPLISGERKAGKSIFALSIATNVLLAGDAVLYFSLEDRTSKVIDRLFAGVARVPIVNHHLKSMSEAESQRIDDAFEKLAAKKMFIRDDIQDLGPMCAVIRQRKARNPELKLVVVDYAQLVRARMAKGSNREQEVAAVSRTLRLIGMELGLAIIVLCQLNKEGDTRESKALEQDATAMWKIVKMTEKNAHGEDQDVHNRRFIVIPFQRNGESGVGFPVTFFGHIARVENLSDEQP
jgi:replicative DNA helicase